MEEPPAPLTVSAEVVRQRDAGHSISLGWAARSYHLRVLSFLEDCPLARDAAAGRIARGPDTDRKKVDADLT